MNSERNFILGPNLALYLPLHQLDGSSFMSRDAYGHLCTVTGASWRLKGRYFDGVDDYINLNDQFTAVAGSTTKTLIAWANPGKTDYSTVGRVIMLHRVVGATAFSLVAVGNPASWGLLYAVGTTTLTLDSGVALTVGQPVFLAATLDGTNVRLQVNDAVFTASDGGAPTMGSPDGRMNALIGAIRGSTQFLQLFKGVIGEAYIFSRAFSPLEVERIRLATKWRYQ